MVIHPAIAATEPLVRPSHVGNGQTCLLGRDQYVSKPELMGVIREATSSLNRSMPPYKRSS